MCDDRELKLCTCDPDLPDPDWVLWRIDPSLEERYLIGRVLAPPTPPPSREAAVRDMRAKLDEQVLFDFDYRPAEDDALRIRYAGHLLRFRVREGRWTEDRSNGLAPWRTRLVEHARGQLEHRDERPDPQLDALLSALDGEPSARAVLADWAEVQGRQHLATWLREEARRFAGEAVVAPARFLDAANALSTRLRARLTRGAIEGCGREVCPGRWEALPGEDPTRTCPACRFEVRFHDSEEPPPPAPHCRAPSRSP
jgi:hypothetical protein